MKDGIRLTPCPNCYSGGWIADGMGDWIRCCECNPEPVKEAAKESAKILKFARGAKVKKPVDDLPPAA